MAKLEIIHKVVDGKLLRLNIEIDKNIITKFILTGDFFIYPENAIIEIEKFVIGKKITEIHKLNEFIKRNNIQLIGFAVEDLKGVLHGLSNN